MIEFVGYFTSLQRDLPLYQAVKDRYVESDYGAQTAIGIEELSTPELVLELKCTALIPT